MWVFLNDAFLSIVVPHTDDVPAKWKGKDVLVVRARRKVDLINTFGREVEVMETPDRDYRWRTYQARSIMAELMFEAVNAIDYDNFKDSISGNDPHRKRAYGTVWADMNVFQGQDKPRHKGGGRF